MIIEFTVKNYRSICDEQVFSLVSNNKDKKGLNSFEVDSLGVPSLLNSAAIYGANAAGKSNLIKAIKTMKSVVLDSAGVTQRGDKIDTTPFLLDEETRQAPSEFEAIFVSNNVKYQYGFAVTKERVHAEWLLAFPNGRPQRWFDRYYDSEKDQEYWEFGGSLLGKKTLWRDSTKSNSLFLSTAVQLNSEQLQPVYDWFKSTLRIAGIGGWEPSYSMQLCEEEESRKKVLSFLKAADLDICDVKVKKEKFDIASVPDTVPESIKSEILQEFEGKELLDVKTVHTSKSGEKVLFDFDDESDGTRKLFSFAGPWLDSLEDGNVLFIDELHDSLHPKMVKFLVDLFHNKQSNLKNAQLVFTTHETSILDQNIFGRDQIWFCEKDKNKSTSIYPLSDFSVRKGSENLEKSYLSGRYGALPYITLPKIYEVD